jgi:hypothetical protein
VRGRSFAAAVDEEEAGSVFTFKLSFALDIPNFYKFFTTSVPVPLPFIILIVGISPFFKSLLT